jgi:hypothetical protein
MVTQRIMSTDYKFICTYCHKAGGYFTRNDADVIDSFQFVMKHTDHCGSQFIKVISEYDDEYFALRKNPPYEELYPEDKSKSLDDYFPHSGDWDEERYLKRFEAHEERRKAKEEAYIREMEELKKKKRGKTKADVPLEVKKIIKEKKTCECILKGFKMEASIANSTPEGCEYELDEDGEKKIKYYRFNVCSKCYSKWRNKK